MEALNEFKEYIYMAIERNDDNEIWFIDPERKLFNENLIKIEKRKSCLGDTIRFSYNINNCINFLMILYNDHSIFICPENNIRIVNRNNYTKIFKSF